MNASRPLQLAWSGLAVLLAAGIAAGTSPSPERGTPLNEARSDSSIPQGELHLTGKSISRLVLVRLGHGEMVLESPPPVVRLPEGKYWWQEVRVDGGQKVGEFRAFNPQSRWMQISADQPATIDVGAPLKPSVQADARGKNLLVTHELRGGAGEHYSAVGRTARPRFTVFHQGQPVGSGQFEYG